MLGTAQSHREFSRRVTDEQFKACCQIIAKTEKLLETLPPSTREDELDQAMVLKIVATLEELGVESKAVAPLQPMCASLAVRLTSILSKSGQTTQKSEQITASSAPSPDHSGATLEHLPGSLGTSEPTTENPSSSTTTEADDDLAEWDLTTFLRSNLPTDSQNSWWNMLCSFVARAVSTVKGTHVSE